MLRAAALSYKASVAMTAAGGHLHGRLQQPLQIIAMVINGDRDC